MIARVTQYLTDENIYYNGIYLATFIVQRNLPYHRALMLRFQNVTNSLRPRRNRGYSHESLQATAKKGLKTSKANPYRSLGLGLVWVGLGWVDLG